MRWAVMSIGGVILVLVMSAPLAGRQYELKDPGAAVGFAWLCPGCGHLYTGETTKGALIAVGSVGSAMTGLAITLANQPEWDCQGQVACSPRGTNLTPLLVGTAVGLVGYIYGLIDAGPSARRVNAAHGFEYNGLEIGAAIDDGRLGAQLMLSLPAFH